MQVIKRDGSIEEFNVDKIISAVEKAFKSCNKKMPQYLYDIIGKDSMKMGECFHECADSQDENRLHDGPEPV